MTKKITHTVTVPVQFKFSTSEVCTLALNIIVSIAYSLISSKKKLSLSLWNDLVKLIDVEIFSQGESTTPYASSLKKISVSQMLDFVNFVLSNLDLYSDIATDKIESLRYDEGETTLSFPLCEKIVTYLDSTEWGPAWATEQSALASKRIQALKDEEMRESAREVDAALALLKKKGYKVSGPSKPSAK